MKTINRLAGAWFVLLVIVLTGCHKPGGFNTSDGFVSPLTPAEITYEELAEKYNAAIAPLNTLWSRADIDMEWAELDKDGDRRVRSESGDGKFIMRRGETYSTDTAMTVEKLGKIYLWAGSNQTHYYLFDRVDGDNKKLYVGSHDAVGSGRAYPLPIHPSMVPTLMGLEPLPVSLPTEETQATSTGTPSNTC